MQPLALGPLVLRGRAASPRASSTACIAAAHCGVRFPFSFPAPWKVVSSATDRPAKPSSPSVSGPGKHCRWIAYGRLPKITKLAPQAAAPSKMDIRVAADILGQPVGPVADLPRPRLGDLPGTQRVTNRRVPGLAVHPAQRAIRRHRR